MPVRLVALIAALIPNGAVADILATSLGTCRAISDNQTRLACYDALPLPGSGEVFEGKGNGVTPPFDISAPRLLNFESNDAVMIAYLLDDGGRVIQNLHRGGAGRGSYLIETPGRYHLQVNATGGWRMTLTAAP